MQTAEFADAARSAPVTPESACQPTHAVHRRRGDCANWRESDRSQVLAFADVIDLRDASTATLTFKSWLVAPDAFAASRPPATVQVSLMASRGSPDAVPPSDEWQLVQIDLTAFAGEVIRLRFVLATAPLDAETPMVWRIGGVSVRKK